MPAGSRNSLKRANLRNVGLKKEVEKEIGIESSFKGTINNAELLKPREIYQYSNPRRLYNIKQI